MESYKEHKSSIDEPDYAPTSQQSIKLPEIPKHTIKRSTFGDIETKLHNSSTVKTSLSTLEKLQIFHFPLRNKNKNDKTKLQTSSIARIFGNNYSTKKGETLSSSGSSSSSSSSTHKTQPERFHKSLSNDSADDFQLKDISEMPEKDISTKAIRTLSRGLGRLLRRRSSSIDISEPDPEFKVAYLGNVLTGWAKGKRILITYQNYNHFHFIYKSHIFSKFTYLSYLLVFFYCF